MALHQASYVPRGLRKPGGVAALTIILVDDDSLMHRMLLPRLRELPIEPPVGEVISALTPDAALAALAAAPPGPLAVLSDFNLKAPLNGVDVLRRVREARPDAVRVLFSGYSLDQLGDVAGADAHAFLEKPMVIDEMVRPLARIIRENLRAEG